jgi:transketolase C-terminal domain/subunit
LRKPGTDAVIITWGTMVRVALEVAQLLEGEGSWTHILL